MDFNNYADEDGVIINPYAGNVAGRWIEGITVARKLQEQFGHCETLDECIDATESEGLKRFFASLKMP